MPVPDHVRVDLQRLGLDVPDVILARLESFLDRLLDTNTRMNLTAVRERDAAWSRLILDSLTPLPWLDAFGEGDDEQGGEGGEMLRVADVGSGGGLPGIPLALARPDLRFTLIEATGKKARFLQETVEAMSLDHVTVVNERAEVVGQDPAHRARYAAAISRAIGPLPLVLEWSLPLLQQGGQMLAMKGPRVEAELAESGDALEMLGGGEVQVFDAYPEGFDNDLVIVKVTKDRPTPPELPRPASVAKASPL